MAAAAILNFEKLMPFSYFFQVWWKCCDFEKQHIYDIEKRLTTGNQNGGCRHLDFRKTDAVVQTPNENTSAL